jgi:hypothetical protein
LVKTPFAAPYPLEMLDRIGDVCVLARDSRFRKGLVEHTSRRSDERTSLAIFLIARLLANKHDVRLRRAFAEDGLRASFIEVAPFAVFGCLAESFDRAPFGQEFAR